MAQDNHRDDRAVAPQETSSTQQQAIDSEPDRVIIAKTQAAIIKLLAKAILESHNKSAGQA